MNAVTPSATFAPGEASAASLRWAALTDAAAVIAPLAGIGPETPGADDRHLPARLADAEPWRRELAENGIADLAAVMEPGIAALLAIHARGADSRPAATALWREFITARDAILALLPASGANSHRMA